MATRRQRRVKPPLPPQDAKPAGWLLDRIIEQAVYLERLKRGEGKRAAAPMEAAGGRIRGIVAGLIEQVGDSTRPWESAAHAEAVAHIAAELRAASKQVEAHAGALVIQTARLEAEWQGVVLAKSLPVTFDFSRVPEAQIAALARAPIEGRQLADWANGIEQTSLANVTQSINRGLQRGAPMPEIAREVRQVLNASTRAAEAITRTAVTHASSGARMEFAQANADLIVGVQWVSTLDSRTTVTCASLDGKVFPLDSGPRPPAHVGCRSTTKLLTRTPDELLSGDRRKITPEYLEEQGKRASRGMRPSIDEGEQRTKEVRGTTSYGGWLKTQPAATQDRVLGATRARLFRSGMVPIEGFVGDDHQPLTIEEIAARWDIDIG